MNKGEFIKAIATKAGSTVKDADTFYNAMVDVVADTLANDSIVLAGFGTYKLVDKPERTGINPATRAQITIPATKAPTFKFGTAYKDKFNK